MNRSGINKTSGTGKRDILFNTKRQGYGVQVNQTGVTATNADGKKIIYAGQALGAATDPRQDALRQTELSLVWADPIPDGMHVYGVTQHDIIFNSADEVCNANLLYMATIDNAKMDPAAGENIPDAVRVALQAGGATKVFYIDGSPQVVGPVE